jgi:hypothetical protein
MKIIRNSARCDTCEAELESRHVHDFRVHVCPNKFVAAREWVGDQLVEKRPQEPTFNWGVDGGKEYVRRLGSGFTDTSILENEGTEHG